MQIFFLDRKPFKCALYHNDAHIRKMIIEYAQLLCTALQLNGHYRPGWYKPTHVHRKCTQWVAQSWRHYYWLHNLALRVYGEWRERGLGKPVHASGELIKRLPLDGMGLLPDTPWQDPPVDMDPVYPGKDAVEAYRNYYMGEKRHLATWCKGTYVPSWWK
jgi:hypothetical protein